MKYFAYGTNINNEQMKSRCPSSEVLSKAKIGRYKFIFNSRGVATIIPDGNFEAHGVLYEIDKECLGNLKQFEGYPHLYRIEKVEVIDDDGCGVKAIVFIATDLIEGKARKEHLNIILEGAQENNLPLEYIKNLKNKYGLFSN